MIDLTQKDLPNAIVVNGKSILLNTDYRVWLEFWKTNKVKYKNLIKEVNKELKVSDVDELNKKLKEFLNNPNEYPHYNSSDNKRLIDYYLDGEYIYSAFMTQYHIDLLEVDMHWHKFKALVNDLNVGIISYAKKARGYEKRTKKDKNNSNDYWEKEKQAWQLTPILTEEEKESEEEKVREFEEYFNTD